MSEHRPVKRKTYTVAQVAAMTGYCEATIRRWIRAGDLPALRPGKRHYRIADETVERLFAGELEGLRSRWFARDEPNGGAA